MDDRTVDITLMMDRELPEDRRPAFIARFPSSGTVLMVRDLIDQAANNPDDMAAAQQLRQAIQMIVIDWRNFSDADGKPLAWDGGAHLLTTLTINELFEAAGRCIADTRDAEYVLRDEARAKIAAKRQAAREKEEAAEKEAEQPSSK